MGKGHWSTRIASVLETTVYYVKETVAACHLSVWQVSGYHFQVSPTSNFLVSQIFRLNCLAGHIFSWGCYRWDGHGLVGINLLIILFGWKIWEILLAHGNLFTLDVLIILYIKFIFWNTITLLSTFKIFSNFNLPSWRDGKSIARKERSRGSKE